MLPLDRADYAGVLYDMGICAGTLRSLGYVKNEFHRQAQADQLDTTIGHIVHTIRKLSDTEDIKPDEKREIRREIRQCADSLRMEIKLSQGGYHPPPDDERFLSYIATENSYNPWILPD